MIRLATACALAGLLACSSSPVPCATAHDCSPGERCTNKVCQGPDSSPGALGDSCNGDAQCGSGLLCNPLSISFPNGFCTVDCSSSSCASGICTTLSTGTDICSPGCGANTDCRQGYVCCPALGSVCAPAGACTPAACERPVTTSSLPVAQVIVHETHKVGETVNFTMPAGIGAVSIVQQALVAGLTITADNGQVYDNSAVPLTIRGNGQTLWDVNGSQASSSPDGGQDNSGNYAMFGGGQGSTAAFTMPNTTASLDGGIPAGPWQFTVSDYAYQCTGGGCSDGGTDTDTYDVSVLVRPKPAVGEAAKLDVNFYIVSTANGSNLQPFTAASAATDPAAQRMVSTYRSFFANAGITVDKATFYDVPGTARDRFATNVNADFTGACDELDQMFLLSAANPGNAMDVFLVDSIRQGSNNTPNATIVGIDGSIPGPAGYSGTVHSGAVVTLADLFSGVCSGGINLRACGADHVAFIAAHETGHFLGLFHTTEMEGADFDPIADSPKCPCLSCASATDKPKCTTAAAGTEMVTNGQCNGTSCGGGNNLMFWLLDSNYSTGALSAQQGAVMRLNPAVHP